MSRRNFIPQGDSSTPHLAPVLGLDIGGANLKMAHTTGTARTVPFELWKQPQNLAAALRQLVEGAPAHEAVALTMTGELCDCFANRRAGVCSILEAASTVYNQDSMRIWRTDAHFVDLPTAMETAFQVASANWLALATWAGRLAPRGLALLIDIGSTTTDLVPLQDGIPIARGRSDAQRLREGELVYRGARRTPICWKLRPGLAAELFATMLDAMVLLGKVPENPLDLSTADGRPATKKHAHDRLARMLGEDGEECPQGATNDLAEMAAADLCTEIGAAARQLFSRLHGPPAVVLTAGSGEFLGREIIERAGWGAAVKVISLGDTLGPELSSAACAYAVAVLAAEKTDGN